MRENNDMYAKAIIISGVTESIDLGNGKDECGWLCCYILLALIELITNFTLFYLKIFVVFLFSYTIVYEMEKWKMMDNNLAVPHSLTPTQTD